MLTPAQVAAQRAVAQAMIAQAPAPRSLGEGLSAIGKALIAKEMMNQADTSQASGLQSAPHRQLRRDDELRRLPDVFPVVGALSTVETARSRAWPAYWLSVVNPFTYAVELVRFAAYGQFNLLALGVIVTVGILAFGLAARGYTPPLNRAGPT